MIGPLTPTAPRWMCAAVTSPAEMPLIVSEYLSTFVASSNDRRAKPLPGPETGGFSWAPVRFSSIVTGAASMVRPPGKAANATRAARPVTPRIEASVLRSFVAVLL